MCQVLKFLRGSFNLVVVRFQGIKIENGQVFPPGTDGAVFFPFLNVTTHDDSNRPDHAGQNFMGQAMD